MEFIGRLVTRFLEEFGGFMISLGQVLRWTRVTVGNWTRVAAARLTGRPGGRALDLDGTVSQMVTTGVHSVPVAVVTAFFTGMVLALQTGFTLERKLQGVSAYLGGLVSISMLRELGP